MTNIYSAQRQAVHNIQEIIMASDFIRQHFVTSTENRNFFTPTLGYLKNRLLNANPIWKSCSQATTRRTTAAIGKNDVSLPINMLALATGLRLCQSHAEAGVGHTRTLLRMSGQTNQPVDYTVDIYHSLYRRLAAFFEATFECLLETPEIFHDGKGNVRTAALTILADQKLRKIEERTPSIPAIVVREPLPKKSAAHTQYPLPVVARLQADALQAIDALIEHSEFLDGYTGDIRYHSITGHVLACCAENMLHKDPAFLKRLTQLPVASFDNPSPSDAIHIDILYEALDSLGGKLTDVFENLSASLTQPKKFSPQQLMQCQRAFDITSALRDFMDAAQDMIRTMPSLRQPDDRVALCILAQCTDQHVAALRL